ncbi:hypothetical protein [Actinomadura chokoriensis]|uniref:Aminotransferase class I/II-fold pyridoxal phosphate-dependent enzyme n=1 Tax=Actinomadura chokoriensis TaxID=454156 RepID=A0ABV4QSB4_9ACTN
MTAAYGVRRTGTPSTTTPQTPPPSPGRHDRSLLPDATVHGAAAGLHLTITFDAGFSDMDLAAASLARGVKVQPLSWHRPCPGRPGLVLGYAASTPTVIAEAVAVIGEALRRVR